MQINNKPSNDTSYLSEENKGQFHTTAKIDDDLYHEEDDIVLPIVRVKYIKLPNNGCNWKIMKDDKVIFLLEGNRLTKIEKSHLQTVAGFSFLLLQAKVGIKSTNSFKKELKTFIEKSKPKRKRGRPKKNK